MCNECYSCAHKHPVPGDRHIKCVKPDTKMTGDSHGIKMGWFLYPLLFDPVWKTSLCDNFEIHTLKEDAMTNEIKNGKMFDVVAVNLDTKEERVIAANKTEKDAEAIISMAVMRRGVDKEFFKLRKKEAENE